jgi:hypothetical protein
MNTTHKPWGRLEQSRYSSRKDLGGFIQGLGGIGIGAGVGTIIGGPAGTIVGGLIDKGVGMIGGLFSANKEKKQAEEEQRQALMEHNQAQRAAMPVAQGGIQGGTMNPLNAQFGGYLNTKKYNMGGPIDPPDGGKGTKEKKNRDPSSYADLTEEEQKKYMSLMKTLKTDNPNKPVEEVGYIFNMMDNPGYAKMLADAKKTPYSGEDREIGSYYPKTKDNLAYVTNSAKYEEVPLRYPITEKQFVANPDAYTSFMNPTRAAELKEYLLGIKREPIITTKKKLTRDEVLKAANETVSGSTPQKVEMEKGGYMNPLKNNDLLEFKTGGKHSQNPLGGIPMGYDRKGIMNTVEQGESAHKFKEGKYVFSNKIKVK